MTDFETLAEPTDVERRVSAFAFGPASAPPEVRAYASLLLMDTIGVGAAATDLDASQLAREHAAQFWAAGPGAPEAPIPFDGRPASPPGAAFAFATQIDNLDAHDGWQESRGHTGAALVPALLAFAAIKPNISGREALDALLVGYEVACRAAVALHATTEDYHTSGAWNGLGVAAMGARLLGLDADRLRHAFGIAEYHGPRSQMMREIANPSMLHDGSAMGAAVGVMATLLAERGFRGAPAATVAFADAAAHWADLGVHWRTNEHYVKPYPVCRWAHAPIDGALALRRARPEIAERAVAIEIRSFAFAAALSCDRPTTTEAAQYALAWPTAAAVVRGVVGVDEVTRLDDPRIGALTDATVARTDPALEAQYPERRLAEITVVLDDGERVESGVVEATGGPKPLPSSEAIRAKFHTYVEPRFGTERSSAIEAAALGLDAEGASFSALASLLHAPPIMPR